MSSTQTDVRRLEDQFVYDLEAAYDMEVKLVDALDEMAREATNDKMASGFETHRDETETHVRRLEEVFEALGREPNRRTNHVVDGLLQEKEEFESVASGDKIRDLHFLMAGLKTERIEITHYEGLIMVAEKAELGDDVTGPLEDVLDQEEKTFRKLQGLSTGSDLKTLWNKLTG